MSVAEVEERPRRSWDLYALGRDYGIYGVLVAIVIAATVIYPGFLTWNNVSAVLSQNASLGIVAVGMTFVIICGGFDLSVGSVYAMSGTFAAMFAVQGHLVLGFVAGLATGAGCGFVNAYVVTRMRVNPFIATLGTSTIFTGIVLIVSHSNPITVNDPAFKMLGQGYVGVVPVSVIILVLAIALTGVLLKMGIWGRKVLSVGGNAEASRLAGLRVNLIQGGTYVVCGLLAALGGLMSASQLGVGQGTAGASTALQAIAVVVVGGTSLLGGEGSIVRTLVGLLILATLNNIFFSLAVSTEWQGISQGLIIIAAVALDQLLRRRARRG
jgi:ribose/xylose/arabinose/galactoside ABC-type transport system permease subunit